MKDKRSSSMWVSWWARMRGEEQISEMSFWWLSVETTSELFDELLLWLWFELIWDWNPFGLSDESFSFVPNCWLIFSMYSSCLSSDCNFERRFWRSCDTSERKVGFICMEVWVISLICDINLSSRKSYGNVSTHSANNWIKYCENRLNFGLFCASFCYWNKERIIKIFGSANFSHLFAHLNKWF